MINYDSIDYNQKQAFKNQLIPNAKSLCGINLFISRIEAIKIPTLNILTQIMHLFTLKKYL